MLKSMVKLLLTHDNKVKITYNFKCQTKGKPLNSTKEIPDNVMFFVQRRVVTLSEITH